VGNLITLSVDGDNAWDDGFAAISGTRVLDNDSMGYAMVAGYKLNDRFTFEAGYGFVESDIDEAPADDEAQAYYANVTVTLAPGVFFVPEIGRFDGKEAIDGETTYYGIKWQINF
jgi:long-subunit fatty acid transport protein